MRESLLLATTVAFLLAPIPRAQQTTPDDCSPLGILNAVAPNCSSGTWQIIEAISASSQSLHVAGLDASCNGGVPTLAGYSVRTYDPRSLPASKYREFSGFSCDGTIYLNTQSRFFKKFASYIGKGKVPPPALQVKLVVIALHEVFHAEYGDKLSCDAGGHCRHAWVVASIAQALCAAANEEGITPSEKSALCLKAHEQLAKATGFYVKCECASLPPNKEPNLGTCAGC